MNHEGMGGDVGSAAVKGPGAGRWSHRCSAHAVGRAHDVGNDFALRNPMGPRIVAVVAAALVRVNV